MANALESATLTIMALVREQMVDVADSSLFAILRVLVLTQRNIRVRRRFGEDSKK